MTIELRAGQIIGVIHNEGVLRPAIIREKKGNQALVVIEEDFNDLMNGCFSRISRTWWLKNMNAMPVNQILPGFDELMRPVLTSVEVKDKLCQNE
jgi:hypothetical protein